MNWEKTFLSRHVILPKFEYKMNPVILVLLSLTAISASKYQIGKEESSLKVIFLPYQYVKLYPDLSKLFKIHTAFLLGSHSNLNWPFYALIMAKKGEF